MIKGWKKWKKSIASNMIWNNEGDSQIQVAYLRTGKWVTTIWETDESSRKDFYYDKKSKALFKAKSYMKKHPNG